MTYIELFGGLIYLLMGGDLLVRGAVALSRRAHVDPLLVALTIVALGTSLPELVVSVQAALSEHPGIALGNVVGSNIANVLLVAGAPAVIYPLVCSQGTERRDSAVMLGISLLFGLLCLGGELGRSEGMLLLAGFAFLSAFSIRAALAGRERIKAERTAPMEWVVGLPTRKRMIFLFIAAGLVGLPVGANLFVDAVVGVAESLGVGETIVGLTIVAVGTSLPELATTVVAAVQRHTDVAIGTVIGSNMFNLLAIMGAAAVTSPIGVPVPRGFLTIDVPVMLVSATVLTVVVWTRGSIGRRIGGILLAAYLAYVTLLFLA